MRIFVAGSTGAIGQALLPLLHVHDVVGMTRTRPEFVASLGAEPAVCDVYDRERLFAVLAEARPEVVIDLLTDLGQGDFAANNRIRREGTPNLVDAAVAAGARRLLVESVAFELPVDAAEALAEMERLALASELEVEILRFGLLWGPNTWHQENPGDPGRMHVREAADVIIAAL
jgi:nucleoside-diphosphate-sugar epimerase